MKKSNNRPVSAANTVSVNKTVSKNNSSSQIEDNLLPLLSVRDLVVSFDAENGAVNAVNGVSLSLDRGRTLGIVGESGCGKSVTALSIMGLLPRPAGRISSGRILFQGDDLTTFSPDMMQGVRGRRMAMIFQEPMTALNPVHRIGSQLQEVYHLHFPDMDGAEMKRAGEAILEKVGIADIPTVMRHYPHQLSGGMRQRVMIAMALAASPDLLIADEPTTALDVTVQAQILSLIRSLQKEMGMSVMLITHDLGVIARSCEDAAVMYAGTIVERATVTDLFRNPAHPYTRGLLSSIPGLSSPPKTRLPTIAGRVPGLDEMPEGCRFSGRCPHAMPVCTARVPREIVVEKSHLTACHLLDTSVLNGGASQETMSTDAASSDLHPSGAKKTDIGLSGPDDHSKQYFSDDPKPALPEVHQKAASVLKTGEAETNGGPVLVVEGLKKYFPVRAGVFLKTVGQVHGVDEVSLDIKRGETLGLVGESGCGKSTLARCVMGLYPATAGRIQVLGQDLTQLSCARMKEMRLKLQMIFQDPYESLNGRMTVGEILKEKYRIHRRRHPFPDDDTLSFLLERVGLSQRDMNRFPHEFSGGQRQRIGIARAVSLDPEIMICDEPVSALDVSVQSQILNLMMRLQEEMGLTYLFISHDLAVIRHVSDRIAVMYLGKIMEMGPADRVYHAPLHPYTRALLSAVPVPDPRDRKKRIILEGEVPSPERPPSGCRFHTRCPDVMDVCRKEPPVFKPVPGGSGTVGTPHETACHLYG